MRSKGSILTFRRDTSGNFAIITALAALPMVGLFGLCIDYGIALSNKSKLDDAADAAAVAAITTARASFMAKSPDAVSTGKARGLAVFAANAGKIAFSTSSSPPIPNIDVSVSDDGLSVESEVSYSASNSMQFGRLFNVNTVKLGGSAKASLSLVPYIEIDLLVDISESMGIGATKTSMTKMYSDPAIGCVFACHNTDDPSPDSSSLDTYQISEKKGYTLRIDVIKSAIQNMIDQAEKSSKLPSTKPAKIGVYTFYYKLQSLSPPTTSYDDVRNQIKAIDLAPDPVTSAKDDPAPDKHADTYTQNALLGSQTQGQTQALTDLIGKSGDGFTESNPKKFLFVMTDGTSDTVDGGVQSVTAYDPAWFDKLKKNGVTVGVVYTTYLPFYQFNNPAFGLDFNYQVWILPINGSNSKIRQGLQNIASGSPWFIEASDASTISSALSNLLTKAQSPARLTN